MRLEVSVSKNIPASANSPNSQTFRELYDWSVGDDRTDFWEHMWNNSGLVYEGSYSEVSPPEDATSSRKQIDIKH